MSETTEQYITRMKTEYLQQRAEENRFEESLNGDYSLENIKRVINNRYSNVTTERNYVQNPNTEHH